MIFVSFDFCRLDDLTFLQLFGEEIVTRWFMTLASPSLFGGYQLPSLDFGSLQSASQKGHQNWQVHGSEIRRSPLEMVLKPLRFFNGIKLPTFTSTGVSLPDSWTINIMFVGLDIENIGLTWGGWWCLGCFFLWINNRHGILIWWNNSFSMLVFMRNT